MRHMLDYLTAHPEKGLLGYEMGLPVIVQYWRSFDQLVAFAKDGTDPLRPRSGSGAWPGLSSWSG